MNRKMSSILIGIVVFVAVLVVVLYGLSPNKKNPLPSPKELRLFLVLEKKEEKIIPDRLFEFDENTKLKIRYEFFPEKVNSEEIIFDGEKEYFNIEHDKKKKIITFTFKKHFTTLVIVRLATVGTAEAKVQFIWK